MRSRVGRDWAAAWLHHHAGPPGVRCRACGTRQRLELAHLWRREADLSPPIGWDPELPWREPFIVVPWRVVLLCGPATDPATCHGRFDGRRGVEGLDLLGKLTVQEECQVVADAGRLHEAYRRLTGGLPP